MSDEVVDIYLATGLSRIGEGGGVAGEDIRVHVVPLAEADAWLRARMAEGLMVDPKTWAGLFFAGSAPAAPGQAERDRLP
jgi:ADP-ribose pyrophosphatase